MFSCSPHSKTKAYSIRESLLGIPLPQIENEHESSFKQISSTLMPYHKRTIRRSKVIIHYWMGSLNQSNRQMLPTLYPHLSNLDKNGTYIQIWYWRIWITQDDILSLCTYISTSLIYYKTHSLFTPIKSACPILSLKCQSRLKQGCISPPNK